MFQELSSILFQTPADFFIEHPFVQSVPAGRPEFDVLGNYPVAVPVWRTRNRLVKKLGMVFGECVLKLLTVHKGV